jgi:hypothetical protein
VRANVQGSTKWYIGERWHKQGHLTVLTGRIVDITDTIEPYINHSNEEVNLITSMIVLAIEDIIKLRGLTVTERDKISVWNQLKERAEKK